MNKKPSLSAQVMMIEDLETRNKVADTAISALLNDYDRATSDAYKRFIVSELDKLGYDRDYLPTDHGTGFDKHE